MLMGDQQVSDGFIKLESDFDKVFSLKTQDGLLVSMGCAGAVTVAQNLHYRFRPPRYSIKQKTMFSSHTKYLYDDVDDWLIRGLIPSMKRFVETYEDGTMNAELVVGVDSRLYVIKNDFSVSKEKDFCAVGSGSPFALGALFATQSEAMGHNERLSKAMKAAQAYSPHVGNDHTILVNSGDNIVHNKVEVEGEL